MLDADDFDHRYIFNRLINLFVSVSDNIPFTALSIVNFGRQSETFLIFKELPGLPGL